MSVSVQWVGQRWLQCDITGCNARTLVRTTWTPESGIPFPPGDLPATWAVVDRMHLCPACRILSIEQKKSAGN